LHLQRRRKLPAWCNRANPCTTVDVPSFGRRRTVRYPLVRAPRTTPTNAQVATLQRRRKLPAWVVRLGTFWLGALVRGGSLEFFKALAPARGPGRRPKRAEEPPGRVSLGKGGEVCPVGSCQGLGPTTRPAEAYPKAEAGDTPRYLGPYGPWMPLRLWSYLCGLSRAVGLGGFESGPALQQGSSWQFAAMVG
jgi:hypothetical protein